MGRPLGPEDSAFLVRATKISAIILANPLKRKSQEPCCRNPASLVAAGLVREGLKDYELAPVGVEEGRKVVPDCQGAFSVAGSEGVHLSLVEHVDPNLFSAGTDKLE